MTKYKDKVFERRQQKLKIKLRQKTEKIIVSFDTCKFNFNFYKKNVCLDFIFLIQRLVIILCTYEYMNNKESQKQFPVN